MEKKMTYGEHGGRWMRFGMTAVLCIGAIVWPANGESSARVRGGITVIVAQGRHLLFAPVKINGQDAGVFLVDTGGHMSVVDAKVIGKQGLQPSGQAVISGSTGSGRVGLYDLNDLTVGTKSMGKLKVVGQDLSGLSKSMGVELGGILGADCWKQQPFTVDYAEAMITFHDPAGFVPPAGATKIPLTFDGEQPLVAGEVEGKCKALFLLDTGASAPASLDGEFVAKYIDVLKGKKATSAAQVGVTAATAGAGRVELDSMKVLGQTFEKVQANAAAPSKQPGEPGVIIGGPILEQVRLTFDYANKALYVVSTPVAPLKAPLAKDFKVDAKDVGGCTPLMMAANDLRVGDVKVLLDAGADVTLTDNLGQTALHAAASRGSAEIVKLLLDRKADVNAKTAAGTTVLLSAVDGGPDVVKLVLAAKPDVNAGDAIDRTPLMMAALKGDADTAKLLLDAGAKAGAVNKNQDTVLMPAALSGKVEIAKMLLAKGVDVNAQNAQGHTALMMAANAGQKDMVQYLLDNKADASLKGKRGETAADAATMGKHPEIAELLNAATK